jgi:two-component system, cell cycle sensor histidine kinase and response regulator CckA
MPAKRLLANRDRKFRLLFEEHPQAMWIVDTATAEFLAANAAACTLYGYTSEEFTSMTLDAVEAPEEAGHLLSELDSGAQPTASAWHHRDRGGRLIEVEIAVHQIQYEGHNAALAVVMDITSRRQLEEQLRQAQKMEAIGMLTGGVAHDFNNLLTIITGYSQLILAKASKDDPNRHSAEQIVKAAERAGELTGQLLAFSRRRTSQARPVDLNAVAGSLSTMMKRLIGEDIELRLSLGDGVGRVMADPGQIEQVLLNLAVNSRDAMPKGGVLTIETVNATVERDHNGRTPTLKTGNYVLLMVSDTGCGMDDATRARIFEPFFTTKGAGAGTGLGLFTVAGIVKRYGGAVDVVSTPGRGTCFQVYLPLLDREVVPEAPEVRAAAPSGAETILLVEDEDMVRKLVCETLEARGYRVLEASGSAQARVIANAFEGRIHLLITDVVMPNASGRDVARTLLRSRPETKVLYISGYGEGVIEKRGVKSQKVAFLPKPFTPMALAAKVREVLEGDDKARHAGE